MKTINKYLIITLLLIVGYVSVHSIGASSATTNTFAIDRKGQFVVTQSAYLPDQTYLDVDVNRAVYVDKAFETLRENEYLGYIIDSVLLDQVENQAYLTLEEYFEGYVISEGFADEAEMLLDPTYSQDDIEDAKDSIRLLLKDDKDKLVIPEENDRYLALDAAEDMFIDKNDFIYLVDTGNARIVIFNPIANEVIGIFDNDEFESPKGIYITDDYIYVADTSAGFIDSEGSTDGNGSIFKLDFDGNIVDRFYKPDSASFGQDVFAPKKVAVDSQGGLYIVAEGIFDGIIQLSQNGDFLGYFTKNQVQLTARQRLENLLFSDEQLEGVVDRNPTSFSNIYVDINGIKYTTSHGENISNLKKHNTDGSSSIDTNWGFDMALVDVYTDAQGIMYAAGDQGYIFVLTSDGSFIFAFGTESDEDVVGFYNRLSSIAVDSLGRIWTLDSESAVLQSYTPTDYSKRIFSALTLYKDGKYAEAVAEWEEVLKLNQLSVLAHNEIGRNLYSQGEYEEAMGHFILSGNRNLYSESFWEVRQDQMQKSLPLTMILVISALIVYQVVKRTNKQYAYLDRPKAQIKKFTDIRIVSDVLFMFSFIKHPLDSFYYLKRKEKGSYKGATIVFLMFFVTYMLYTTSKGFIYQYIEPSDLDLGSIILGFYSIFFLFVISNYLVTSINDGEGSIGEVYKGVAYSLMPIMLAMLITTYMSHKLTYGEVILLDLVMNAGTLGTGLFIFLAVQELHNYTIRETIKSFLMTFLFMLIVAVLIAFIQIMGDQLVQFVIALFEEAIRNVFII